MNRILLAYLAGVLDSEGCIRIKRVRNLYGYSSDYSENVTVDMNFKEIPLTFQKLFGGYLSQRKKCWHWEISDKKAIQVCEALLPYLVVKRKQAEILIKLRLIKETTPRGQGKRLTPSGIKARETLYFSIRKIQGYDRATL